MTQTVLVGLTSAVALAAAAAAHGQTAQASPPTSPPSGVGPYVTSTIEKVCLPLIRGQDIKSVVQAAGLRKSHDDWVLQLQGVEKITVSPPTQANPSVCTLTVNYEVDQTGALVGALTAWAAAQMPPLPPLDTAYHPNPQVTSWSWALDTGQSHEGLVLNAQKTADGKPIGRNSDVGVVLFSFRGA